MNAERNKSMVFRPLRTRPIYRRFSPAEKLHVHIRARTPRTYLSRFIVSPNEQVALRRNHMRHIGFVIFELELVRHYPPQFVHYPLNNSR